MGGQQSHNVSRLWNISAMVMLFSAHNDFTAPAFLSLKQSAKGIAIGVENHIIVILFDGLGKRSVGGLMYMIGNITLRWVTNIETRVWMKQYGCAKEEL